MKIELDKKQYHTLFSSLQIAGFVYGILGDCVDDKFKPQSNRIETLEKYLLTFAKEYGLLELVEEFEGELVTSEDFIEKIMDDLGEYEEFSFWDLLAQKFSRRDFEKKYTENDLTKMGRDESVKNFFEIEEIYNKEFEDHGVERLQVVKDR